MRYLIAAAAFVLFFTGCNAAAPAPAPTAAQLAAHDAATKAPTCAMAMTAPRTIQGANFFGTGTLDDCSESDWDGVLQVRAAARGLVVGVDVDRSQAAPGNTLDLGSQAVAFVTGYDDCSGTVTWTSDEPDWSLTVDAVCGAQELHATFSGHVYDGND